MTINLEKELIRQNRKLVMPGELLAIQEFERNAGLLENDALERVGMLASVKEGQQIKTRMDSKREETKPFKQERVFHISQIKAICDKYYLRFLPSYHFKGSIDPQLATKIVNFEAAYGVECWNSTCGNYFEIPLAGAFETLRFRLSSGFVSWNPEAQASVETKPEPKKESKKLQTFIVAPAESFSLQERPKDPLFFAAINDEYFYLIHKWGNDLSVGRRLLSILTSPVNSILLAWGVILNAMAFVLFNLQITSPDWVKVAGIMFEVFSVIALIALTVTWSFDKWSFVKKNNWNSAYSD